MSDIAKMADDVFVAVKGWVTRSLAPIDERVGDAEKGIAKLRSDVADSVEKLGTEQGALIRQLGDSIKAIPAGVQGEPGEPGSAGKDAEPVDVAAVIAEVVKQIPVPVNGTDGTNGTNGKDAPPVDVAAIVAEVLKQIPTPKDGKDGAPGQDARDGLEGPPGRDAWQIEVIEAIDPLRKYQRGTWAKHAGGLVVAFRATDALGDGSLERAGWSVILNGIASIEKYQSDDLRVMGQTLKMTNGETVVTASEVPFLLDRGGFKPNGEYSKGDVVSLGGSMWICQVDEPIKKPGELGSSDWRLSVKRGNDGKDGLQGKQGEAGRPGRDALSFGARM